MASDDFTGADTTPLLTHDANWVLSVGDVASNTTILSNALTIVADKSSSFYYTGSTTDIAQLVILGGALPNTNNHRHSPAVRIAAGGWGYSCYFANNNGTNWTQLNLLRNNTYIADYVISYPMATNHTLKITASGTGATVSVSAYIDGDLIGTYDDTNAARIVTGNSGLNIYASATVGTPPYVDDWNDGGTFAGTKYEPNFADDYMWE